MNKDGENPNVVPLNERERRRIPISGGKMRKVFVSAVFACTNSIHLHGLGFAQTDAYYGNSLTKTE